MPYNLLACKSVTIELQYVYESTQHHFQVDSNFQSPNFTYFWPDENLVRFVYRPYWQFCLIDYYYRVVLVRPLLLTHCRCREGDCCTWLLSMTHTHTHSVGRPWTSDKFISVSCTCTTHNPDKRQAFMPPAGFESSIPSRPAVAVLRLRPSGNQRRLLRKMRNQKWKLCTTVLWHAPSC